MSSNTATYAGDVGNDKTAIVKTTGSSGSGTPAVEITVDMGAVAITKQAVTLLIERCTQRIIEDLFPEA